MTDATIARRSSAVIAATSGALFFVWIAGWRVINPTEVGWVLKGDWQWHFLGWHFFRGEAWSWPPGLIKSYLEPIGSALGYTDSIPIAAFALKPLSSLLPNPLQYLGLWFLLCYALQAFFGALVISAWTDRRSLQVIGGCFFVILPALLSRVAHPALSSHWLLLWALWLYWRAPSERPRREMTQHAALGLISGLIHPYLAVMVLLLLAARALDRLMFDRGHRLAAAIAFAISCAAVVIGWWASGMFTVTSRADLQSPGLGAFSMNLLGPFNPAGRSFFLPDLPMASPEQTGEGFQYLGLGAVVLILAAAVTWIVTRGRGWTRAIPLALVVIGCLLFALSPRIAAGRRILVDQVERVGSLSTFRSSGRFFWPVTYAITAASAGVIVSRLRPAAATTVLLAVFLLQVADLHRWFLVVHEGARDDAFFVWQSPLQSAEWAQLLPRYRHIRMYSPEFCRGPIPVPFVPVGYLAGIYGLGVNDGFAARVDGQKLQAACGALRDEFTRGVVADDTVYLIASAFAEDFATRTAATATCRQIDGIHVCVARHSGDTAGP